MLRRCWRGRRQAGSVQAGQMLLKVGRSGALRWRGPPCWSWRLSHPTLFVFHPPPLATATHIQHLTSPSSAPHPFASPPQLRLIRCLAPSGLQAGLRCYLLRLQCHPSHTPAPANTSAPTAHRHTAIPYPPRLSTFPRPRTARYCGLTLSQALRPNPLHADALVAGRQRLHRVYAPAALMAYRSRRCTSSHSMISAPT
jgi:hypothetical protein